MVAVAPTEEVRLQVVENLAKNKIQTSLHYPFLPKLSAFKNFRTKSLARSVLFASRVITLPLFPTLTLRDIEEICTCIANGAG
jgi:dTDP-4-amino-4,6-dideoxygalactose transaminase